MKIHVDIDCTPEEARSFFGLPDVKPMQDHLLQDVEDRIRSTVKSMDADVLFKNWLPGGIPGVETLQQTFWSHFMGGSKKSEE